MSDCRSLSRVATPLHGQPSFCRQYSFASALLCSSIYARRPSERDQAALPGLIAQDAVLTFSAVAKIGCDVQEGSCPYCHLFCSVRFSEA
jgi:hypothetical protein